MKYEISQTSADTARVLVTLPMSVSRCSTSSQRPYAKSMPPTKATDWSITTIFSWCAHRYTEEEMWSGCLITWENTFVNILWCSTAAKDCEIAIVNIVGHSQENFESICSSVRLKLFTVCARCPICEQMTSYEEVLYNESQLWTSQ